MSHSNGSYTGADLFVDALAQYGVTHVFGNPGTTELPIVQSLSDADISYILGVHEDIAVGMAAGYATQKRYHAQDDPSITPLGVVNLHLLPGLAHGLGNLDGADWSGVPLLVTTGQHTRDFKHEEPILSGDCVSLAEQVTKWSASVEHVDALPAMVRRAVRQALTPPTGPVFLELPVDVQLTETDQVPEQLGQIPDAGRGQSDAIADATARLVDADEPVIIVGDQIARSGPEAIQATIDLAEATGGAVYGEFLMAEINFPTSHPQWIDTVPGTENAFARIHDTDTIVFIGISTHTTSVHHERELIADDTTAICIDNDSWELGKNVPADVAILGDPGSIVAELASRLEGRLDQGQREKRSRFVESRKRQRPTLAENESDPRPSKSQLARSLNEVAPDAILVTEAVTSRPALYRTFPLEPRQSFANKSGGLGYGLPASVGAAIAERERDAPRTVVGFVGDGSYLYYPHTLYTAARYDIDVTVIVSDNRNYRILKDNTVRLMDGTADEYDFESMEFDPAVDIAANAISHGADGAQVETADELDVAIERAIDHDGPSVLDVLVHD